MKYKYLLGSVLLSVVLATAYNIAIRKDSENNERRYVESVKKDKSIESYYIARGKVLEMKNPDMRKKLEDEMNPYLRDIFTTEVNKVIYGISELTVKKDLGTYNDLMDNLIPKVTNAKNKRYLREEVYNLGQDYVYSDKTLDALEVINKAWTQPVYIKDAEKAIVGNLAYENPWTMYFLETQLNQIKYKYSTKKKILIIGDSITAGMGIKYKGKDPVAQVENAWWQNIDQTKYDVMFLAVGGMGVLQEGLTNNIISDNGLEMLKYAEKVSKMGKEYDKIVVALGTNDYSFSGDQYDEALTQLLDHFNDNYKTKEYVLVNFYNHEDRMKGVAEKFSKNYVCKYVDVDMNKIDKFNPTQDNIHPSEKGQQQIYEVVKDYFK